MLNLISFLLCWCNSSIEHKITFKKCFIGQRFGHFLLIVVVASTLAFFGFCRRRYEWRVASCRRGGLETNWTTFPELLSSCQLNKQGTRTEYWVELNFRRSWEGKSDRNKTSIIAKENRFILDQFFLIWLHFLSYYYGDEMSTQAFKKRIYEVKVKTYFVLKPSIETQKQIQVIYLN